MKIVYVQALLMDNNEIIHKGKTLGFKDNDEKKYIVHEEIEIVDIKVPKR